MRTIYSLLLTFFIALPSYAQIEEEYDAAWVDTVAVADGDFGAYDEETAF